MDITFLLSDLGLDPTSPEAIGLGAFVLALLSVLAYRKLSGTPRAPAIKPEAETPAIEGAPEETSKERKAIQIAKSQLAVPKEKPSSVRVDEGTLKIEAEARKAEEEALRKAAERKRAEEAARKAEEEAKAAEEAAQKVAATETVQPVEEDIEAAKQKAEEARKRAEEAKQKVEEARSEELAAKEKASAARAQAKEELARAKSVYEGLEKTRKGGFLSRLGDLFRGKKQVDAALMEQVEEVLLTADIGGQTTQKLLEAIQKDLSHSELKDPSLVFGALRKKSLELVSLPGGPFDLRRAQGKPFVILVVGVNGVGKTTTIGKLASRFVADDKTVILAAGDTFRAAAADQLEIWGERTACEVVKGKEGADPSSVIFNAVKRANEVGADVVLADTAGRLHTKSNLMEEIKKIKRVVNKAQEGAPHEVILVLDAQMGQNAIAQARQFTADLEVSGIVLTKLDGTAKGGVVLSICDNLSIPVRFIGVGEKVGDLRIFEPLEFVDALFRNAGRDENS